MLSWFIARRLDAFEKSYDYDVSYMRDMLSHSPKAVVQFFKATALGQFARGVPRDALYAARLVSIISEDCGPCTQLTVTMAEREGVPPEIIRNVVAGSFDGLPEPVRVTARFTLASLQRSAEADALRDEVEQRFGRIGLISIAFAMTAARMYPTVKYALGYGHECRRITVGGERVVADPALKVAGSPAVGVTPTEAVA